MQGTCLRVVSIISNGHTFLTGKMAQKGYLSAFDQAVVSGSNFFTVVILGRHVAPAEYGVFILAWTTMMVALSVQNAIVCTPMSVIGAQKKETESVSYWGSLLVVQLILGLGICLLILLGSLALQKVSAVSFPESSLLPLVAATILSCFFFLGQEFFRRLHIAKLDLKETLINDLVTHSLRLGGLLLLLYTGSLSTVPSLVVICLSFIIGCFIGYCRLSNDIQVSSYSRIRRDFLESWHFGKWIAAELVPYTMSVQGYIYLTALFIGTPATAALGASQSILNATNVLLLSFSNVMTPVAAKRYALGGNSALKAIMTKAVFLSAAPILGFYFFTMLFAEDILNFVYNRNYTGYGWLLIICSLYFIISYFNRMIQIMLYAKKKPDIGFVAKSLSLVVMVLTAYPLISWHGVFGAAAGTVISQVVILAGYLVYLNRALRM